MTDYTRFKVRGYHLDHHGHLNNGAYTEFLEEARWELFENYNAGEFFSKLDLVLTLVNFNINYRNPCGLGDSVEIHTKVMSIGTTSCKIEQTMYVEGSGKVIADASSTFALVDKASNKAMAIEGATRDKLDKLANAL